MRWIKGRLDERGWNKKMFAAALAEASDGRLQESGALGLVYRVTAGTTPEDENRALIQAVLGGFDPVDLGERLEALVAQGERLVEELPGLLAAAKAVRGGE